MAYSNLSDFVKQLEQAGELVRIKEYVNPELEITEITDRISKMPGGGKALLFENTGTDFPVLTNAFGSEKRMCISLGVNDLNHIGQEIEDLFKKITTPKTSLKDKLRTLPQLKQISGWFPKTIRSKAPCQQVVQHQPDLSVFPILKCWPADGGRFITLPVVITKDPNTGIRNVGMYRMQVFEKDMTGMHWHLHKVGARHYKEYKEKNQRMPIAVILGGDPAYTYSATAPLPDNVDEFLFAGFLRKKKVELVKCLTQDIEVPADADIVIEGYVDTNEEMIIEGPFGDHTGFYSLADYYPRFHITCITHKQNAIYPATIVGVPPQEDAYIGKATERIFLSPIKLSMLPEVQDLNLPFSGVAHNLAIVKIKTDYPGHANKVTNSLWGAGQMMFNKILITANTDVDIQNYHDVAVYLSKNVDPAEDILYNQGPLDILDHSSKVQSYGSKLSIDATKARNYTDNPIVDKEKIKAQFNDITDINDELLKDKISLIVISVKKSENTNILEIGKHIIENNLASNIKSIVFIDSEIDTKDYSTITWYVCNNIDPKRDSVILNYSNNKTSCIVIDGTRKTSKIDNFTRDWPNVVVSDSKTIDKIDSIWNKLNLGELIISPSVKFRDLVKNEGAVAK